MVHSDGASVGAPTHARHVNDRSAPAFDINAFAQVLSQYTSQHVPAVNGSGGKAAAIAKSDKPNGMSSLSLPYVQAPCYDLGRITLHRAPSHPNACGRCE